MTEQELRLLGLPQLTAHSALSRLAGQAIRVRALEPFLADARENPIARATALAISQLHTDAGWWLKHQPSISVPATTHWARIFGKEVNQAMRRRQDQ